MRKSLKKNIKKYLKNNMIKNIRLRLNMSSVILLVMLLIISTIILYPIIKLIICSVYYNNHFSFSAYKKIFTSPIMYKSLFNTIKLSLGALLGTWIIGGSLALLCERTDYKHKNIIRFLVFLSFTIPSYILSVSWIEVTTKGGYLCRILKYILPSIKYNFSSYSLEAAIIVLIIHLYPLVFWGVSNALKNIDNQLIKSAKICGASNIKIVTTIIVPLMTPAFLFTGLLVVSRSMANFGVVAELALPIGKEVLTTQIFGANSRLELHNACVLAFILMSISYVIYLYSTNLTRKTKFKMKNESQGQSLIHLGKKRYTFNIVLFIFFTITNFVPIVTIFISSFLKRWGLKLCLKNMTINNYLQVFNGDIMIRGALLNSLKYGIISGIVASIIASLVCYIGRNNDSKIARILMNISQLPITFPNMILAIAAILAWINEPFKLYGTKWIIIITYTVLFIPLIMKQIEGIADNIDNSTDKSAKTLGIPLINRFVMIYVPQIKKAIISGFIICFLISLREIPISLLLRTKGTETLGYILFTIQSNSYGLEMTSTVAVIVIIISIAGNLIINKWKGTKRKYG